MKEIYKKTTRKYNVDGKLIEEIEEVTEKEYKDNEKPFFLIGEKNKKWYENDQFTGYWNTSGRKCEGVVTYVRW